MPQTQLIKLRRRALVACGTILLAGLAAGASLAQMIQHRRAGCERAQPALGERVKPGPWGELSCSPFTIAAPDEALPVRALAAKRTHWIFPNATAADVRLILAKAEVSSSMCDALAEPEFLCSTAEGCDVAPSLAWLRELPARARTQLYHQLAQMPANAGALTYVHKETLDERFAESGLAPGTLELFHQLCSEEGNYLVFAGLETMLAELPFQEEQVRFLKALTRQKTMLLQLYVGPDSDVAALTDYWAKGPCASEVRTKLQSFAKVKGGVWIGIQNLLPPLPDEQIYSYPLQGQPASSGLATAHDCHWTSLNFFRPTPEPAFSDPQRVLEEFQREYRCVAGEPTYGDVVLLTKPDGIPVHSAVYLAGDIVFTKNGATAVHPWMLSTTAELLKRYSFNVPPDQRLTVTYLRKNTL